MSLAQQKRWPFIQWFVSDWLSDPKVSLCEPATRGILFDWLCQMHALDRSGQITGTLDTLARLGRCTPLQVDAALADIERTNAADVLRRNGVVTVVNRRMKREELSRKSGTLRQQKRRSNGPVTPHNHNPESITQNSEDEYSGRRLTGGLLRGLAVRICNNADGWHYDNCKVSRNGFTLAGIETCLRPHLNAVTCAAALESWMAAVQTAHALAVDGCVLKTPEAACMDDFKRRLAECRAA